MMDDNKFNQDLISKIKDKKLSPMPRWYFLLKNYLLWGVGIFSLFVGALAFSVVIYILRFGDWDIYERIGESFVGFLLLSMPYFWLVIIILFSFLVYYNIEHTKSGYRYSASIILFVNILLSFFLGVFFFSIGISKELDRVLAENMPFYHNIMNQRMAFWMHPEAGRLTGIVIARENNDSFVLLDFDQTEWLVDTSRLTTATDSKIGSRGIIDIGIPIRVFGQKATSGTAFIAQEILPVPPPGCGMYKRHRNLHFDGRNEDFFRK